MVSTQPKPICFRILFLLAMVVIITLSAQTQKAQAAEDGKGIYLPVLKGSMAGFVPPPGTYLSSYKYFYSGSASGTAADGATLGSFKGRTTAIGPNINYNFQRSQRPVSTTLRWLHEFDAKNRLEGDAAFFTAAIPLGARKR